jgi:hypothetical protein
MGHWIVDTMRLVLMVLWGIVAWKFFDIRGLAPQAKALRRFAFTFAALSASFYGAFFVANHAGFSVGWHNEVSRFLSYMAVSLFLVWSFMSDKVVEARVKRDV